MTSSDRALGQILKEIEACRICVDRPEKAPLPHEPRPVVRASTSARIAVFGQAPGNLVHQSGIPFNDPSGDRLRKWMDVSRDEFYDHKRIAIIPMGFCFPGNDAKGGDLPPRKECAKAWRAPLLELLPNIECTLLVGAYAQRWHLKTGSGKTLTQTVASWREYAPQYFPLPHPSWRNTGWLKKHPWFEEDVLPSLQQNIRDLL